jgi:putative RecB family exonuclease
VSAGAALADNVPSDTLPGEAAPAGTVRSDTVSAAAAQTGNVPVDTVPADAVAAPTRGPSLSPSRAGDFLTCPLLYRFRVIDRLPEPPSPAAARGTLVHAVLERLFDEPAAGRTPETARAMLAPQWERLIADEPELAGLFGDEEQRSTWLAEASDMLDRYFTLEDPTRLEPRHREHAVEAVLESGLLLRGYIDRLDVRGDGEIRIVDYKTGTAPREEFEARALFQMKFYAVVLWLTQQRVPKLLQLMYLGNGEIVRYAPDESDLRATVRKIDALWRAIERARSTGDWRPRQSRLCAWCAHQAICPAFGGTPPPLPEAVPSADATVPSPLAPSPTRGPADVAPEQAAPVQAGPAQAGPAQAGPAQAAPAGVAVPEGGPRPEIPAQPAAPEEIAARAPRR